MSGTKSTFEPLNQNLETQIRNKDMTRLNSLAFASTIALSLGAISFGSDAQFASAAPDTPAQKACLNRAAAARAAAIAGGMPRAQADRIWAAAVRACKA